MEESVSVPVIDFEQPITTLEYQLSDIAKRVEYVELEASKEAFIGEISKMVITDNHILIFDTRMQKILLFDSKGNFLRKISNRGKGSGEYQRAFDIDITDDEMYTYLYAWIVAKTFFYYV